MRRTAAGSARPVLARRRGRLLVAGARRHGAGRGVHVAADDERAGDLVVERLMVRVPGRPQQAEAEGEAVDEAGQEAADGQPVAERRAVALADGPDAERLLAQGLA